MSKFKIAPKKFNDLLLANMVTLEFRIVDTSGTLNPKILVNEPHDKEIIARIRLTDLINPSSNFYLMKVKTERHGSGWSSVRHARRHKHSVPNAFMALSDLAQKSIDERIDAKMKSLHEMEQFHQIFNPAPLCG